MDYTKYRLSGKEILIRSVIGLVVIVLIYVVYKAIKKNYGTNANQQTLN